jgi:hypothetical protein
VADLYHSCGQLDLPTFSSVSDLTLQRQAQNILLLIVGPIGTFLD